MNNLDIVQMETEQLGLPATMPQDESAQRPALRLLWRDHLRIGMGPKWLAVAGYRRGLRPVLAHKEIIAVDHADNSAPLWQAAVDALPAALAVTGRRGVDVTVVLSNHFVRYALLPWNTELKTETEWLALAYHRFSSIHGAAAEDWVIRIAKTAREGPRIASAIDRALLTALEERISRPASLVSVQPYLMTAFNRMQSMTGNTSCWLVVEEPGRLTLALIQHGVWKAIRSRRKDELCRMTLHEFIERESALLALDEPCTQVVVLTHVPIDTEVRGAYELRDLTLAPGAAGGNRELAMALE
jgi:hypothetical protein